MARQDVTIRFGLPYFQSSVTRHAITWTFDTNYYTGVFANGDPWVLDPGSGVNITMIDPMSTDTAGWIQNGSMINPAYDDTQGYDSEPDGGSYSAANNIGRPSGSDISGGNPLTLNAGESLISSKSQSTQNNWPQITDASVLTCLSSPPSFTAFRPPLPGTIKTIWDTTNIDWELLQSKQVSKTPVSAYLTPLSTVKGLVERVWLDHWYDFHSGRFQPENNMPDYGRDIAKRVANVALHIMCDYTQEEIQDIVISFIQIGIDLYGYMKGGGIFPHDGAIWLGRKFPLLFAGRMLDDSDILYYADKDNGRFQEDDQTYFVDQYLIDRSDGTVQNCYLTPSTPVAYTSDQMNFPEWGIRFATWRGGQCATWSPNNTWGSSYRTGNSGPNCGSALAAIMLGERETWNWPHFFNYCDRYVEAGKNAEHSNWSDGGGTNAPTPLTYHMWEEYRNNYYPRWSEDAMIVSKVNVSVEIHDPTIATS